MDGQGAMVSLNSQGLVGPGPSHGICTLPGPRQLQPRLWLVSFAFSLLLSQLAQVWWLFVKTTKKNDF